MKSYEKLTAEMAARLAEHAIAFGLDDADERLLWRFVAEQGEKSIPEKVTQALKEQGVMSPARIIHYSYEAEMPSRFYSRSAARMAMVGIKLVNKASIGCRIGSAAVPFAECLDGFTAELTKKIKDESWKLWYDKITDDVSGGGKVSPSIDDIIVKVRLKHQLITLPA